MRVQDINNQTVFLSGIRRQFAMSMLYTTLVGNGNIVLCPKLTYLGMSPDATPLSLEMMQQDSMAKLQMCNIAVFVFTNVEELLNESIQEEMDYCVANDIPFRTHEVRFSLKQDGTTAQIQPTKTLN